jgi:hypothetical protein
VCCLKYKIVTYRLSNIKNHDIDFDQIKSGYWVFNVYTGVYRFGRADITPAEELSNYGFRYGGDNGEQLIIAASSLAWPYL